MIKAEIIADSLNSQNCRLTTFILRFPRMILAELNTHRVLSKSSASSRAIPFSKMLEAVKNDPFIPIKFQKDHKGMQGTEYYEGAEHDKCVEDWLKARDMAVTAATSFTYPVTKQLRNRLLEPFMWHTVILTGTEFGNFFALRAHKDAEIHMESLAYKMLEAYNNSTPKSLKPGEWHTPFGDRIDEDRLTKCYSERVEANSIGGEQVANAYNYLVWDKIRIAIARCARVSYNNFEGKDDYNADIALCDRLFGQTPRHLSPTEHVAEALDSTGSIGNFKGFKQYRYYFSDQNLNDDRIVKKFYVP